MSQPLPAKASRSSDTSAPRAAERYRASGSPTHSPTTAEKSVNPLPVLVRQPVPVQQRGLPGLPSDIRALELHQRQPRATARAIHQTGQPAYKARPGAAGLHELDPTARRRARDSRCLIFRYSRRPTVFRCRSRLRALFASTTPAEPSAESTTSAAQPSCCHCAPGHQYLCPAGHVLCSGIGVETFSPMYV